MFSIRSVTRSDIIGIAALLTLVTVAVGQPPEADPSSPSTRPAVGELPQAAQVEPETEQHTYLGVGMQPLPPEAAPPVDTEGVGLRVAFVDPGSPADEAGIEVGDIIVRIDDQWVINAEQFTVLVRMREKGEAVTLTTLRRGEQQEVEVTLGEKELPVRPAQDPFGRDGFPWRAPRMPGGPGEAGGQWGPGDRPFVLPPEFEQNFEEMLRSLADRLEALEDGHDFDNARDAFERARKLMEGHGGALGARGLELMRPEWFGAEADHHSARVSVTEGNVSARLVNENGQSSLSIEDPDSGFSYEGPFPSDEEVEEMPEHVRDLVRQMKRYAFPPSGPDEQERERVRA